mmetsp:Transcript_37943/g.49959  ORF Transcript_37943/g.49959 Transcript_37943/m.49959 type:complete len:351 (+) Transcript_37943:95-1147(+)
MARVAAKSHLFAIILILICGACRVIGFQHSSIFELQNRAYIGGERLKSTATVINAKDETQVVSNLDANLPARLSKTEKARTVTHVCTSGTLCTVCQNENAEGFPFGSHVDFVLNEKGWPVFLLSEQSMHTLNFLTNPKVSLFAQQPPPAKVEGKPPSPATLPRVTITGKMEKVEDMDELILLRPAFSVAHSYAEKLVESPVFSFYKLNPEQVYYVGGFGVNAEWVSVPGYETAKPDILAHESPAVIANMNQKKQKDLVNLCQQFLGIKQVDEVTVSLLDRLGFNVRVSSGKETDEFRIGFNPTTQVYSVEDAKSEIVKLFQEAWEKKEGYEWALEYTPPVMKFASDILRK